LAFGDALHLGGVDAVELALVVALLEIEPFGQGEQLLGLDARMGAFTLDVADDSAEDGVQLAGTTSRPSELPSSCVAALPGEQAFTHPYVGLSERHTLLSGRLYQPLAHSVVEPGVRRKPMWLSRPGGATFAPLEWRGFA